MNPSSRKTAFGVLILCLATVLLSAQNPPVESVWAAQPSMSPAAPEDIAVVAAAKLLGRSIKWIEDRREHFTNAAQERDQYWSIDIAVDADARLLGVRGKLIHDLGAYALQDVNIPFNSASMMSGPYVLPALSIDVTVAATNKTPVSSVRGAGYRFLHYSDAGFYGEHTIGADFHMIELTFRF